MSSLHREKRIQARKSASDYDSSADSASEVDVSDAASNHSDDDKNAAISDDSEDDKEKSDQVRAVNIVSGSIRTRVIDGLPSLNRMALTRIQTMKPH